MWQTLRYALPAFLVPIAFVVTEPGEDLLGRGPALGVLWVSAGGVRWASPRWPSPPAAGCSASGAAGRIAALLAGAAALLLLYLDPSRSRSASGVSARGSRARHHRQEETEHETCDDGVRCAGTRPACRLAQRPPDAAADRTRRAPTPAARSPARSTADTRVGIATGNATGVYFALGNAYAEQISAATGGKVKATAAETGASVQNIQQLVAGNYQVAFSLADTRRRRGAGQGQLRRQSAARAGAARIYNNYTQVVVRNGAGITSSPT